MKTNDLSLESLQDRLAALVKRADFLLGSDKKGTIGFDLRQEAKIALKEYEESKKNRKNR